MNRHVRILDLLAVVLWTISLTLGVIVIGDQTDQDSAMRCWADLLATGAAAVTVVAAVSWAVRELVASLNERDLQQLDLDELRTRRLG